MTARRIAAALLALSAGGDLAGLLNQILSLDRPPLPAMIIGGVVGVVGLAMVRPVLSGSGCARWIGLGSRAIDVALIGGAAAAGRIFSEDCAHSVPAASQFTASLISAVVLAALTNSVERVPIGDVA